MGTIFQTDLGLADEALPHFWEHTVGSGHAPLALRADWQKGLARCRAELGFRHVRFHGLLSDDMGTLTCQRDKLIYSFFNLDQVFDFLVSIGMRPFVELSFMPDAIASGDERVFHYRGNITPPRSQDDWAALVNELGQHLIARYGRNEVRHWFFEVWNEPNLKAFWSGSQAAYFRLYKTTAATLKNIDAGIRIGGPATAKNEWLIEFLRFCETNQVACDFVSTHHYPTDAFGKEGDDTITQLAESRRSVLREQARKAKDEARGKPLYYTEWSSSSNPFDDLHDQPYAAAFIVKTVMEARGLVEGYSYWVFSDIFEENYLSSDPFHGGFGLLTIHGLAKPAYRAYELLHRLGDRILRVDGAHETVDCWIARSGRELTILASNFGLPRHPIATETVMVRIAGVKAVRSSTIERVDDTHANAHAAWMKRGSPKHLLPAMVESIEAESRLVREPIEVQLDAVAASASLMLTLPPQGIALITLEVEPC